MTDVKEMMKRLEEVQDQIAERSLVLVADDGSTEEVLVRIGRPYLFPGSDEYIWAYEIVGGGIQEGRFGAGEDSVGALVMCLQFIGTRVHVLRDRFGGRLNWPAGPDDPDCGFPRFPKQTRRD